MTGQTYYYCSPNAGNIRSTEALLGRVLLRPPIHPRYLAQSLGLIDEVDDEAGTHRRWVQYGGQSALEAASKQRKLTIREHRIARAREDKRYQAWSRGYDCGIYWSVHDISIPSGHDEKPNAEEDKLLRKLGFGKSIFRRDQRNRNPDVYDDAEGLPTVEGTEIQSSSSPQQDADDDPLKQLQHQLQQEAAQFSARGDRDEDDYMESSSGLEASEQGRQHIIHPRIPNPIDYGQVAAATIGVRVRLNVMDKNGETPLLAACRRGHAEIVCLLLSHHDPNLLFSGKIPRSLPPSDLQEFQRWKRSAVEETTVERGNGPKLPGTETGLPGEIGKPGCAYSMPPGYESLITEARDRCDPNLAPVNEHTPLCVAASRGDTRTSQLLLHFCADVNKTGRKEQSTLLAAVLANQEHLLPIFLCCFLPKDRAQKVEDAIEKIRTKRKEKFQRQEEAEDEDKFDDDNDNGNDEEEQIASSMQDALSSIQGDWRDLSLPSGKPGYFGNLGLPEGMSDVSIWPQGVRYKGIGGIFSTWNMKLQEAVINTCSISIREAEAEAAGRIDHAKPLRNGTSILNVPVERWYVRQHYMAEVADEVIAKSPILQTVGIQPGYTPIEVDLQDESGFTPLHIAAEKGKIDSVKLLMAAGADHTHCTMRGKSVIYGAVERGHVGTINAILPFCKVHQLRQKTKYGTDVVFMANKSGNKQVKDLVNSWVEIEQSKEARRLEEESQRKRWGRRTERPKVQATIMERLMQGQHKEDVLPKIEEKKHLKGEKQKIKRSKSEGVRRRKRRSDIRDERTQQDNTSHAASEMDHEQKINGSEKVTTTNDHGPNQPSVFERLAAVAAERQRRQKQIQEVEREHDHAKVRKTARKVEKEYPENNKREASPIVTNSEERQFSDDMGVGSPGFRPPKTDTSYNKYLGRGSASGVRDAARQEATTESNTPPDYHRSPSPIVTTTSATTHDDRNTTFSTDNIVQSNENITQTHTGESTAERRARYFDELFAENSANKDQTWHHSETEVLEPPGSPIHTTENRDSNELESRQVPLDECSEPHYYGEFKEVSHGQGVTRPTEEYAENTLPRINENRAHVRNEDTPERPLSSSFVHEVEHSANMDRNTRNTRNRAGSERVLKKGHFAEKTGSAPAGNPSSETLAFKIRKEQNKEKLRNMKEDSQRVGQYPRSIGPEATRRLLEKAEREKQAHVERMATRKRTLTGMGPPIIPRQMFQDFNDSKHNTPQNTSTCDSPRMRNEQFNATDHNRSRKPDDTLKRRSSPLRTHNTEERTQQNLSSAKAKACIDITTGNPKSSSPMFPSINGKSTLALATAAYGAQPKRPKKKKKRKKSKAASKQKPT